MPCQCTTVLIIIGIRDALAKIFSFLSFYNVRTFLTCGFHRFLLCVCCPLQKGHYIAFPNLFLMVIDFCMCIYIYMYVVLTSLLKSFVQITSQFNVLVLPGEQLSQIIILSPFQ